LDLLSPIERSLFQNLLANRFYSPRIVAHYNYFNEKVIPKFQKKLLKKCGSIPRTWFHVNDAVYCEPDDAYAIMTDTQNHIELLPFDRVIGDQGPIVVVYGDVEDSRFKEFISTLYQSSTMGKLRLTLRYTPPNHDEKEILSGYGVDLTLKRTDYIVIDDRDVKLNHPAQLQTRDYTNAGNFLESYKAEIEGISRDDFRDLDLRIASFALSSKNSSENFDNLFNINQDLPKFVSYLKDQEINRDLLEQMELNEKFGINHESAGMFLNGAPLDAEKLNIYSLHKELKEELKYIQLLKNLRISTDDSKKLIGKYALISMYKFRRGMTTRYLIDKDGNSNPVIYLNNIEEDGAYKEYSRDITPFLRRYEFGEIPQVRSNIHTAIFVIHLSNREEVTTILHILKSVTKNGIAQQVGIIPLSDTDEDERLANKAYQIAQSGNRKKLRSFLEKVQSASLDQDVSTDENYVLNIVKPFVRDFDIEGSSMIVNGVFYDFDENWPYSFTKQVTEDNNFIMGLVYHERVDTLTEIKEMIYEDAYTLRNTLLMPTDSFSVEHRIVTSQFLFQCNERYRHMITTFGNAMNGGNILATLTLGANFSTRSSLQQLIELLQLIQRTHINLSVRVINTGTDVSFIEKLRQSLDISVDNSIEALQNMLDDDQLLESQEQSLEIKALLKTIQIDSSSFILLNGRFVNMNGKIVSSNALESFVNGEVNRKLSSAHDLLAMVEISGQKNDHGWFEMYSSILSKSFFKGSEDFASPGISRYDFSNINTTLSISFGDPTESLISLLVVIDPATELSQKILGLLKAVKDLSFLSTTILLIPQRKLFELPIKRFYRSNFNPSVQFKNGRFYDESFVVFDNVPEKTLFTLDMDVHPSWIVVPKHSETDLDNVLLEKSGPVIGVYELQNLIIEGNAIDVDSNEPPAGLAVQIPGSDTNVMGNFGYLQLKANPGIWDFSIKDGRSLELYSLVNTRSDSANSIQVQITSMDGAHVYPKVKKNPGKEPISLLATGDDIPDTDRQPSYTSFWFSKMKKGSKKQAEINIFSVASGHLYERLLSIMTVSVMRHTKHSVKFWLIDNYMSANFREFLPHLAEAYGFEYELITYKWQSWLVPQREKQRTIWGYKILFLDVLFPQDLDKVIFVDADQIVRADMIELVEMDLEGAPYAFTPMGDSRKEMEGFRFWKQGYWKKFLSDKFKYHISALYVVDLKKFRSIAAGDKLRQHYQALSRDPASLSNLDQDLPNNLQTQLKIFSLPQDWLWCETWCDDESLKTAKTIDLCNNPLTKEPKLVRARRQIPEWNVYDEEVSALRERVLIPDQSLQEVEADAQSKVSNVSALHDEL
jgi:UDP-glucose:glycoprotein glucosyltransferase